MNRTKDVACEIRTWSSSPTISHLVVVRMRCLWIYISWNWDGNCMSFGTFNVTRKTQFSPTKKYAWLKYLRKLRRECMSSSLELLGLSFDAPPKGPLLLANEEICSRNTQTLDFASLKAPQRPRGKERTVAKGQKGLQDEIQCRSIAIPILGVIVFATSLVWSPSFRSELPENRCLECRTAIFSRV